MSSNEYGVVLLVAYRTLIFIFIVEFDGDRAFGYSCLPLLIYQLLKAGHPNLRQVGDAQNKADGVQNIRLATSIEPGNGVEVGVKTSYGSSILVGFESF